MSNKAVFILLGSFALALALAAGSFYALVLRPAGWAIGQNLDRDTLEVGRTARQIADFELPADYQSDLALDFMGMELAGYTGPCEGCHLYLVQAPQYLNLSAAELENQLAGAGVMVEDGPRRQVRIVEQYQSAVRGQQVLVSISEGINGSGQAFRSLTAVFEGKGGPALVNLSAPLGEWDQAAADAFLASLR